MSTDEYGVSGAGIGKQPFADIHPPHKCAGSSHALSDRSDRSDRSDEAVVMPKPPACATARYPKRLFADIHPPHKCAGPNHALSDRSDRSDRSDEAVVMPKSPAYALLGSKVVRSRVPPPEAAESRACAFLFQLPPVPRDKRFFICIRLSATLEPLNP